MRKTVLIIGASSFVGSNLLESLKDDYRVVGTYYQTPLEVEGVLCLPCDVLRKESVQNLVGLVKPDITIYAVGLSSLTDCQNNSKLADALNTSGVINSAMASDRNGSKFVLISSAYVMSGEQHLFKESDAPFPNTTYGNTFSSSEFYVQKSCLNYFILRCSLLYGRSHNPFELNWFELIERNLSLGKPLYTDDSVVTGFLDIKILANFVKTAIDSNLTNRLIQLSSSDYMTRYEFARLYAQVFHKNADLIVKSNWDFPINENQAKMNRSQDKYYYQMSVINAEDFLGQRMPTIEESLQFTKVRLS
jgi:dTDP-4-dehydrorhamnose reductase